MPAVVSFHTKNIFQYRIAHLQGTFPEGQINFAASYLNTLKCVAVLYVANNEERYSPSVTLSGWSL